MKGVFGLCMLAFCGAIGYRLSQDIMTVYILTVWAGTVATVGVTGFVLALCIRAIRVSDRAPSAPHAPHPANPRPTAGSWIVSAARRSLPRRVRPALPGAVTRPRPGPRSTIARWE